MSTMTWAWTSKPYVGVRAVVVAVYADRTAANHDERFVETTPWGRQTRDKCRLVLIPTRLAIVGESLEDDEWKAGTYAALKVPLTADQRREAIRGTPAETGADVIGR